MLPPKKTSHTPVILLDAGTPIGTPIVRCLALAGNYQVVGISFSETETIHYSRCCRIINVLDWQWDNGPEALDAFAQRFPDAILLPGSENAVVWMARHKQQLSARWKMPLLASASNLEIATDKGQLATALINWDLAGLTAVPAAEVLKRAECSPLPAIVKPRNRDGGRGVKSFHALEDLTQHLQDIKNIDEFIVQRYVSGQELSCGVLCDAGRVLACVIYRPLSRRSQYGPYLSIEFVNDAKVLDLVSEVMQHLKWSGVANVDVRYDEQNENPYVLEINARFWGNILGAAVQGINFPDLACRLASNQTIDKSELGVSKKFVGQKFFGLPDACRLLKQDWREAGKRENLLRNSMIGVVWRDPLPTVYNFWRYRN